MKLKSRSKRSGSFRPGLAGLVAMGCVSFLAPVMAQAASCDQISSMREQLRNANTAIASQQAGEAATISNEDFDAEEQGCLTEYVPKTGLGLPGFAELLDGLKDAACSAANAYIGSQVKSLGLSLNGPMGLVGLDVGLGEDKCAKIADPAAKEKCKKNQSNFEVTDRDIGVDYDAIFDRIEDEMPKSGNRFDKKFDYSGDEKVGDYYLDQGGSKPSDFGSDTGGRR